jgi:hypothetical protein
MALTADAHTDLGVLLGFALRPTQRPGRSEEYRRVLGRYRTDREFRDAFDAVAHGLSTRVLSDGEHGLVLGVETDSPFAFRLADLPNMATRDSQLLAGLILLGLAAWAYPSPADLDDDKVRWVEDVPFEKWLRDVCERLRDTDAAGEIIPEQGLDDAWRVYASMPERRVGTQGRGAGRLSPKCTLYWVRNVLDLMTDQGLARKDKAADRWMLTSRFQVHVRDMAAESAYRLLADLGRAAATAATEAAGAAETGPDLVGAGAAR